MVTAGILPFRENSYGWTGNRTRGLMFSSQRLWPLDHEAGRIYIYIYVCIYMTYICIYIYDGDILCEVGVNYPRRLLLYQHTFFTFAWDAECRSRKTLCWSVGAVRARCILARRRPQNGALGEHTAAGQKDGKSGLLNRDEGEQIQGADFCEKSHG